MADGFTDFLSQAASQLGSGFSSGVSTLASGAGAIGSGLASGASGSASYLSSLAQQAYAPRPELATPSRTMAASTMNIPSIGSGGGSNFNWDAFNTQPTLSARSTAPSMQPSSFNLGSTLSGFGDNLYSTIYGKTPQQVSQQISPASPLYPISPAPIPTFGSPAQDTSKVMIAPSTAATPGTLIMNIPGAIPKPADTYLTSMPGYTKETSVGDTRTQQLIGKTVKDITTGQDIKIGDTRDALEFQRQEALAGLNPSANEPNNSPTRAAQYYRNELDKLAQNDVRLSSDYHYQAKKSGVRQEANPWENSGDAALAFLKGGNVKDDMTKNYAFNEGITGPQGVLNLLPEGKGSQESAWDQALGRTTGKISNYLPAIAAWKSAGGTMGPYGSLGSYDSEGKKIPVPSENITKMPEAYKDVLGRIAGGERGAASTYTFNFPELASITPVAGSSTTKSTVPETTTPSIVTPTQKISSEFLLPEDVISANAGTTTPSTGLNLAGWWKDTFGSSNIFSKSPYPGGLPALSAGKVNDATIDMSKVQKPDEFSVIRPLNPQTSSGTLPGGIEAVGATTGSKSNNWFFGMDLSKNNFGQGLSGVGTMLSSTFNPQAGKEGEKIDTLVATQNKVIEGQYIPVVNNLIQSGAKVTDSEGNPIGLVTRDNSAGLKIEYDPNNVQQTALNSQLTGINKNMQKNQNDILQADAKYRAIATDEAANSATGVTSGLVKKILPGYEEGMGGFIDTSSQSILKAIRPDITDADIKSYYQKPGNLTMTEMFKTFGSGEKGYTKDVFDPVAGKMVKQTFTAPEGVFRDVIYPFSKSFIENPREHPLEFVAFSAMPVAFEGIGQGGSAALTAARASSSPTLSAIGTAGLESTALKTGYNTLSTAFMGNMALQQVASIPGYDVSVINPLFGKPVAGKLVVGYDENKQPIYADTSAAASSERAGEAASNLMGMTAIGMPLASHSKFFGETPSTTSPVPSLFESTRSKVINLLDRPTTSNPEAIAKLTSEVGAEGGIGTRPVRAVEKGSALYGENMLKAIPNVAEGVNTPLTITPKPGELQTSLLMEGDTTLANAAARASITPDGSIKAVFKGSIGADVEASGTVQPGLGGGIRRAYSGLLKDLDIEALNPVTYVKDMAKIASKDLEKAYADRGVTGKVEVEPYYPDGYIGGKYGQKTMGQPRNPYNVEFKIKLDGYDEAGRALKIDQIIPNSKLDLKLYGQGSPKLKGEGVWNFYNFVRTPNYEQSQPFIGIGTSLLGSPTMRSRFTEEMGKTGVAGQEGTEVSYLKLSSIANDKWDNALTTIKTATREGKSWNPEVEKLPKSFYDTIAMKKESVSILDQKINAGAFKGKDLLQAEKMKTGLLKDIETIRNTDIQIRPAPTAKVEVVNIGKMVDAKSADLQTKADIFARPQAFKADLSTNYMQQPFVGGTSATAITGAGVAGVKVSKPSNMENIVGVNFAGRLPGMTSSMGEQMAKAKGESSTKETSPKTTSASASSEHSFAKFMSSLPSDKSKGRSASEISSMIVSSVSKPSEGSKISKPSEVSSPPSSGGSKGSGSSSYSSSSIYSSMSSSSGSSGSSGSGSSSSSMGSRSSSTGGSLFGAPFLAPPGGGGGGGGAKGHLSGVIKNPLAELRVASAGQFKRMFDFSLPNKLAGDVSKNLRQTQPYGTTGAANAFSRGASSSIQEATNLGIPSSFKQQTVARKPKKSKPKVKAKVKAKSGKKKGTYK